MRRRLALVVSVWLLAEGLLFGYQHGYVRLNYPSRSQFPVRGIDVSRHQGEIDWPTAVRSGDLQFAYIKASEGRDRVDPRFEDNWRHARGLLARGAYHFFTFCSPGDEQAANFLKVLPSDSELPAAVDVEFAGNCQSWESLLEVGRELRTFIDLVEDATGRKPTLYVTKESFARLVRPSLGMPMLWLREVVWRPSRADYPTIAVWQYAGNGRIEGIPKLVDLDVFMGSRDAFGRLTQRS